MATVIRSANIAGDGVTIGVKSRPAPIVQRNEPIPAHSATSDKPVSAAPMLKEQQNSAPTPKVSVEDNAADALLASLREREKRLQEREQAIEEELVAERKRVHDSAYAEGYRLGETQAAQQYRERLDALNKMIESAKEEFARDICGLEDVVVSIAFEAICKIIGSSMHDQDGVLAVVREIMSHVKDHERLVLRVSPRDYDLLCKNWDALFGDRRDGKLELVPDDRVLLGGCLAETSGGTIDGRLEIQMQQLRDTLISARKALPE